MIHRIVMLLALALTAACAAMPPARNADPQLVADAFHFGFPVYEMVRVRHEFLERVRASGRGEVNRFGHRRTLSDHTDRSVTTPNNDTLYSAAWLDLTRGPLVLSVPETGKRYFSLALMDIFTDNFAYAGTRASKGRAERLFIAGPNWQGRPPGGTRLVRAPTNDVWALSRILVDGPSDLPAGLALQDQLAIIPHSEGVTEYRAKPPLRPTPEQFLNVVNEALGRSPVPPAHAGRLARLTTAGIRPGATNVWGSLSPGVRQLWSDGWPGLNANLRGGLDKHVTRRDGWSYPRPGLGNFGQDDVYRAAVALEGLAALEPEEAMYMFTRTTASGAPLDARTASYRLRLPRNIPVDGFWSLTMYEDVEDRLFFVDNPIRRYSIGNRTPGLIYNADGTLDILIQHARPAGLAANWLPAPQGPFRLGFRAYLPRAEFRDQRFTLPGVQPLPVR
jgi:hypothetical protein